MTKKEVMHAMDSNEYTLLYEVYKKYKIDKNFDVFFAKTCEKNSLQHRMLFGKVKDIFRKLEQSNGFDLVEVPLLTMSGKEKQPEIKKHISFENKVAEKQPEISLREINLKPKTILRPIIDSNPHVNRDDLPENLQQLYDENGFLNGEMKTMHAAMKVEPDTEKRKVFVNESCILEDKINANWLIIDKWYEDFKNGKKPEEQKDLTPKETSNKIEAAQRYMDRYFNSENPKQIAKFNGYKEFLKSIDIDYIPRPLRDDKRQKRK